MLSASLITAFLVSGSAMPVSCKAFEVPTTIAERTSDATLVGMAYGHKVEPTTVTSVLRMSDWRIVWAVSADDITTHAFIMHGSRYRGKWDAVGEPRSHYLAFARKLNVPGPLARCFADRMQAEPSI